MKFKPTSLLEVFQRLLVELKNIHIYQPQNYAHVWVSFEEILILRQQGKAFTNLLVRVNQGIERFRVRAGNLAK